MRKLTVSEFTQAPSIVQFIYACSIFNNPIGTSIYEKCMKEFPEYFPDEIEHSRKFALIPEEVHEQYKKEFWDFKDKLWKDEPKSVGISGMFSNPEGYKKWEEAYYRLRPIEIEKERELHNKYYSKYGI